MTYIDYLNDFNQWLETNNLSVSSQLMFYKLLYVFNRAGWPEDVGVDNLRLRQMLGNAAETTVVRARDALVEAGFITYKKGRKGRPNRYSLCGKHYIFASENASVSASEIASVSASENASHIKTKTKTKKDDDEEKTAPAREDEGLGRVMAEYMDRIDPLPSPTSLDLLKGYVAQLGPEVCLRAIYRACDAGARKWTYIYATLKNCATDGIKSVAEWDRKEEERRGNRGYSVANAAGNCTEPKKWDLEETEL